MTDPKAAIATQLRNIETKTGKTLAEIQRMIAKSGLSKVSEQRSMLMELLQLGYGDANRLALSASERPAGVSDENDSLEAIYAGPKASLRALHVQVMKKIGKLGPFEISPKKSYVSLRRKKQFATVGPATRTEIEIGLNAKDIQAAHRLKKLPAGGMCQYTVRISQPEDIDAELIEWIRTAYGAAG